MSGSVQGRSFGLGPFWMRHGGLGGSLGQWRSFFGFRDDFILFPV